MPEPVDIEMNGRSRRGAGLTSRDGLTNGAIDPPRGLEVGVGLINGLPEGREDAGAGRRPLLPVMDRRRGRRAVRERLERRASEPLPGAEDG